MVGLNSFHPNLQAIAITEMPSFLPYTFDVLPNHERH